MEVQYRVLEAGLMDWFPRDRFSGREVSLIDVLFVGLDEFERAKFDRDRFARSTEVTKG